MKKSVSRLTIYTLLHPAPICDPPLVIPHNSDKKTTKNGDFIGQEITIECREGFEFTDTPAVFTAIEDNTVSLGDTKLQAQVESFYINSSSTNCL